MKVKIDDIIDAVDFDGDMSESYLNTKTTQVCIFTDEELRSAKNNEDDGDVTINGICIDVKTTKHQTGRLCAMSSNPSIDLLVMMVGENGYYRLAGGMPAEDMYRSNRWGIPSGMKSPCYSAVQEELMTPKQVFDFLV